MTPFEQKSAELEALLIGHWLTDLANFAAFVFLEVPDLNWAGFYLVNNDRLVLGPFHGKPACTEIRLDRGVCGAAFSQNESLIVADVHEFPGHIACDAASKSELVIPLSVAGTRFGVLDLDSPTVGRFSLADREGLELWIQVLLQKIPASQLQKFPWQV